MKIILTEEDVKRATVSYLISAGQLSKDIGYEVTISSYDKDFMMIQAVKPEKEGWYGEHRTTAIYRQQEPGSN